MSGLLSTVTGAVSSLSTLFGGYGTVTLGSITFTGQEVPEKIGIGGLQLLKIHKLPGGARVVDAMGRDDAALSWSGILISSTAEQRMLQIDALRVAGQAITLAFGSSTYEVVVSEFKGDYRRTNWCEYSITCEVVQDNSAIPASTTPSLLEQISSDMSAANSLIPSTLTSALGAVGAAQSAVAITGAISQGTAAFTAATNLLGTAETAVTNGISAAGSVIDGLSGATGILGTVTGFGATGAAVTNLASAVTASNTIGALTAAGGYIERTTTNLASGITTGMSDILSAA